MITDAEIIELERLLWEQNVSDLKKGLVNPVHGLANPNYVFLFGSIKNQKYDFKGKLSNGYRGCVLEGSSRSGKTWSGVDIIIWLCLFIEPKGCSIKIYRDVYASFKDTLYDDFKKRLDDFGLNNPFHNAQEVKTFKIGNSRVSFLGCDKIGKAHGSGCDYAFFNEGIFIPKEIFDQVEMRCRKFWWIDYNPSFSDHWIFDSVISRPDVGFLRTTFKDNPHLSNAERNKILSYEPWLTNSYEVKNETELWYNGSIISDTNQPPPHPENVKNGTADVFMWTVYGLGLRGAMQGVIFNNVHFINKEDLPKHLAPITTIDFGFTNDPCAITDYYEDGNNIYIELKTYKPIDNPEAIGEVLSEMKTPKSRVIVCDSADKYTHENKGAVEMVKGLQRLGWKASKISKTKSVMFWITSMKKKKIHIIINYLYKEARKERENYKWKEINGILINQPEDKFNHMWDSARYGHMSQTVISKSNSWAGAFG